MNKFELKALLDEKVAQYNQPGFIADDPVSIPHSYSRKEDIEITGFFAAMLAWGQRKTIINKCRELFKLMDDAPYEFIVHHKLNDLKRFTRFKHRTFNDTDCLYFIRFLKSHYSKNNSLETAFQPTENEADIEGALVRFHKKFFSLEDFPPRTKKHVATPERKSACKRINMYLRWMVRDDQRGVDFGIWKSIPTSKLICPCDLHVERVARKLKMIKRKPMDWLTAVELTAQLRKFDPNDPVKYDFALFGLGLEGF
ncbi:MAG: TIGR02757 family protein [Cyclobacteriaceae bacterium]|nr:TIGR02757 family protein [Cyclobacteriaceae bacterium]